MIGTVLGPYRIDRALGAGGMGSVWAATVVGEAPGLAAGTAVALKVLHPHLIAERGFLERFLREAAVGRAVVHPNVVRTFDCDAALADGGPRHYLVTELVEGRTVRDLLGELGHLPEALCRHLGHEAAKGLTAIHAAGAVHRDVKPENLIVTADHVVKVMDLGVAAVRDEAVRLSRTGAFVGSVEYAAPEQFRADGGLDGRADLHALGAVLYELATGTHPFRGDDFQDVMRRVLDERPRRAGDLQPQLSPFFEEVVGTLLAKRPEDRFASATEVARILDEGEGSAWWRERARSIRAATRRPLRRIRIPRETAVYGREPELGLLRGLFDRAAKGEGRVALVEGEAGIGKTRLVDEFVARLREGGEDLDFLFGAYPPTGAATAAGGLSSAFREHLGEPGSAPFLADAPALAPAFDAVLRGEPPPAGAVTLTLESLGTCFVHVVRRLAAERTLVVLIDDLHFAPEDARRLFLTLALAVPGHRVLLVGTARPGVDPTWIAEIARIEHATHLELGRLGPKDLALLLRDTFRSEQLATELGHQVAIRSDGNPFFVFEILRGLREGQFITRRADGTWASTRAIGELRIPSTVRDLVNARVAGLTEEQRALLDVAACWGYEFDPGLVGDVLGLPRVKALTRFGQVERAHRLVRASGRMYVFDHHQVREALYESLHEQLREEYHAALAAALEAREAAAGRDPASLDGALCVDLCEHFLAGARGERALRYLGPAMTHLERGHLGAQSAALAERALSAPGLLAGLERARVLARLGRIDGPLERMGCGERHRAVCEEAERIATAAGDRALAGEAALALGAALVRISRYAEAEAALGRALALAREDGDRRREASATGNLGNVCKSLGRLAEAREHHARHLALSREAGDRVGEASATGNLGLVLAAEGRLAEARELGARVLRLARELGDLRIEAAASGNLGIVLTGLGLLEDALACHRRHLELSREIGYRHGEANASGNLAIALTALGRPSEAREHGERLLALSRETGYRRGEAIALHNLGCQLLDAGDREGGLARLRESQAICDALGDRVLRASNLLALGRCRDEACDPRDAAEAFREACRLGDEGGFCEVAVEARCRLALLPGGDAADAVAAYERHERRLGDGTRRRTRLLLWRATGDRTHLGEARRLADAALGRVSAEARAAMLANVPFYRELAEACRAAGRVDERGPAAVAGDRG